MKDIPLSSSNQHNTCRAEIETSAIKSDYVVSSINFTESQLIPSHTLGEQEEMWKETSYKAICSLIQQISCFPRIIIIVFRLAFGEMQFKLV